MTHVPSAPIPGSARDKAQRTVKRHFDEVMRGGDQRPVAEEAEALSPWTVMGQAWGETVRLTTGAVRSSVLAKALLRSSTLLLVVVVPTPISAVLLGLWMAWEPYCLWRKWERRRTSPKRGRRKGLTVTVRWA